MAEHSPSRSSSASHVVASIDLETVALIDYSGNDIIDLRNLLMEFNIYEDLHSSHMRANVTLVDALGVIERLPIIGEETLLLSFSARGEQQQTASYGFRVVNIQNRGIVQRRTHAYTLQCVSTELINDFNSVVRTSFNGVPISAIVNDVYQTHLVPQTRWSTQFTDVDTAVLKKQIHISQTDGLHHFVSPEISPIQLIQFLAEHAKSAQYESSSFIFFENTDGFHFKTLEELCDGETTQKYFYTEYSIPQNVVDNPASQQIQESQRESQKIISIDFLNQISVVDNYENAMYNSELTCVDPLTKVVLTTTFDYATQFKRMKHIDKYSLVSPFTPHGKQEGETNSSNSFMFQQQLTPARASDQSQPVGDYKNLPYFTGKMDNDPQGSYPFVKHDFTLQDTSLKAGLNNIVLNMSVPGDQSVRIGDIVSVNIPQGSSDDDFINRYNILFGSGTNARFLVTAVNHHYNARADKFFTHMQIAKDSYAARPTRESQTFQRTTEPEWTF